MTTNSKTESRSLSGFQGYKDAWSHIQDELTLLDLKIQLHLTYKKTVEPHDSMEHLKGLVLFEEEIQELLKETEMDTELEEIQDIQFKIIEFEDRITQKVNQSLEKGLFLPLSYLSSIYSLSSFEEKLIVMALAFDVHRKYEKLFAYLQDDVTCKRPTIDLAMRLNALSPEERMSNRNVLVTQSTLKKYFFKDEDESSSPSFMSKSFRLDERMMNFLIGFDELDSRLMSFTEIVSPKESLHPLTLDHDLQYQMRTFIEGKEETKENKQSLCFHIWGETGSGKKFQVKHFSQYIQKNALLINVNRMMDAGVSFVQLMDVIIRETVLQRSVLCFYNSQSLLIDSEGDQDKRLKRRQWIKELQSFTGIIFILANKQIKPAELIKSHAYIDIQIKTPQDIQRKEIWEEITNGYTFDTQVNWGSVANKFRFTYGQIEQALKTAKDLSNWGNKDQSNSRVIRLTDLHHACYTLVEHNLEKKAVRINPKYTWDDLILPPEQKEELRNACNQMKYRHIVYGTWGFDKKLSYGKGLSMLFTGPPGTGKTMSAQIIAQELDLQIYKIDLSQVISKYIGETEKNLHEVFTEAQYSHAILFFDETDALFSKRSEVKDSHDKYANIETSYLLQKIEEYEGISVLASNYLQNIDEAFMRRINFIIKYPFPDQVSREQIWNSLFPNEAPLSQDIDIKFLAEKLELSGGHIKNIVLSSAFLAAEKEESIGMKHIIKAAKHEIQKSGKIFLKDELGSYDPD